MPNALAMLLTVQIAVSGNCTAIEGAGSNVDAVLITQNTRVMLMATGEVDSDHAIVGTAVRFRVNEPVIAQQKLIIPVGTPAFGMVVSTAKSGFVGRTGKMEFRLSHVQLGDTRIPISGSLIKRGTAGSTQTAFATAGIFGIFHHGNSAKIKAGDLVESRVAEDVAIHMTASCLANQPIRHHERESTQ